MAFGEYGTAMERKLAIAEYHRTELESVPTDSDSDGMPSIPLQAHFEAAGRAIASMPDQLATGIVEILQSAVPGLPGPTSAYLHTVLDPMPDSDLRGLLEGLVSDDRYCDLRAWRNRAAHRFDQKAAMDGIWIVAPSDDCHNRVEPRDVAGYIRTMLDFGREILEVAPAAEDLAVRLRAQMLQ